MMKKLVFLLLFVPVWCVAASDLTVLTHNVWYGFTADTPESPAAARHEKFRKWVAEQKPDVVALQELNGYTEKKLAADAKSWGHTYSALLKTEGFPTGITSNKPITGIVRRLDGFHHGLLRAETHGHIFYVIHLHPSNWETRHRETDTILKDLESLSSEQREKVILLGDFNTFSEKDASLYARKSDAETLESFFSKRDRDMGEKNLRDGKLEFGVTQKFAAAGWIDLAAAKRDKKPAARFGTFPTKLRAHEDHGRQRRLDYIFARGKTAQRCTGARIIDDATTQMLSDHLPVIATFTGE